MASSLEYPSGLKPIQEDAYLALGEAASFYQLALEDSASLIGEDLYDTAFILVLNSLDNIVPVIALNQNATRSIKSEEMD